MEIQNENRNKSAGAIFIGCMFVGMGLGMFFNKTAVGVLIGMGIGFIASGIAKAKL